MQQTTGKPLEIGEEYLTIDMGGIKVNLFKNKNQIKSTDPAYIGSVRVAMWINTKKAPAPDPEPHQTFQASNGFRR